MATQIANTTSSTVSGNANNQTSLIDNQQQNKTTSVNPQQPAQSNNASPNNTQPQQQQQQQQHFLGLPFTATRQQLQYLSVQNAMNQLTQIPPNIVQLQQCALISSNIHIAPVPPPNVTNTVFTSPALIHPKQWTFKQFFAAANNNADRGLLTYGVHPDNYFFVDRYEQPLSSGIGSLFAEHPMTVQNPQLSLPQYHAALPPEPRPTVDQLKDFTEDNLFYLIYGPQYEPTTITSLRYHSLRELSSRQWKCIEELHNTTNLPVWALDCTSEVTFQEYLQYDVVGGNELRPKTAIIPTTGPNSIPAHNQLRLFLIFNPVKWEWSFQHLVLSRVRVLTTEDLLK